MSSVATESVKTNKPVADRVREIWCEILGIDSYQYTETFIDLGGTSLSAEKIAARVRASFAILFSGSELMRQQTLQKVTELITRRIAESDTRI
jgi:acyl carrier protein